jgi:hypothetical protein
MARRAPSPPLEPPGVSFLLCGFRVRPKIKLYVSGHYKINQFVDQMFIESEPHHYGLRKVRAYKGNGSAFIKYLRQCRIAGGVLSNPGYVTFTNISAVVLRAWSRTYQLSFRDP